MALPSSAPPSRPAVPASAHDLRDAEFAELDAILAEVPEPLEPFDVVMLDGFLAGVIVQPALVEPERWLAYVFDAGGHRWGEAEPGPAQRRARELILRRHAAIHRALVESGGFEPFILEPSPDEANEAADAGAAPVADPVATALAPWVEGFAAAIGLFPGLEALDDERVETALVQLSRWLPDEDEPDPSAAEPALAADAASAGDVGPAAEAPRAGEAGKAEGAAAAARLDAAIAGVVAAVADLHDAAASLRYRVDPVRRDAPKVGRNAACPCGSGRKFKLCHGAGR